MNTILIFAWIYAAMTAMSFWEASVEGRNPWDKKKLGYKFKFAGMVISPYHVYLFGVMWPLLLTLPFVIFGWDTKVFGVLVSAFASGSVIEDFVWYLVNPKVKLREFWTKFSDYYPWLRIGGRKIIPLGYILGIAVAIISWYFLWRV